MIELEKVYTKKGRYVEFPNWSKKYALFLLVRSLAFTVDIMIPLITETMMFIFFGASVASIITVSMVVVYMMLYNVFFMMMFKGKTLGMKLGRITAVHASGFRTETIGLIGRALLASIYVIPIFGWALIGTNIISGLFLKGFTLVDYCSVTVVVSDQTYAKLKKIEDDFERDNEISELKDANNYGTKKGEEYDNW